MNNSFMKNETLKKLVVLILILIIICVCSMAIYLSFYDKKMKTDNGKMSEFEQKYFMDNFISILDKSQYTSTNFNINNISNHDKIKFALTVMDTDDYSYDYLLSISKKYFGETGSFHPQNIVCSYKDGLLYQYDEKLKLFKFTGRHGHGGNEPVFDVVNSFVEGKIEKKEGVIKSATIKVRKSFSDVCNDVCGISLNRYGTFEDALNIKNISLDLSNQFYSPDGSKAQEFIKKEYQYIVDGMKKSPNKYPIHTYFFRYIDGNYYLESISVN